MNKTEAIKRLKPCPFCGGKVRIKEVLSLSGLNCDYFVGCDICGARTEEVILSPEYSVYQVLVDKWNRRDTELAPDGRPNIITTPNENIELPTHSCSSTTAQDGILIE